MEQEYTVCHINYALVEGTRPPMYKAMKYWGKKPHNIWNDYIKAYCPKGGTVLDPFVGSGVTAFEGLITGRKVIATDLNPLCTFFIEVMTRPFKKSKFEETAKEIIAALKEDEVYKQYYVKLHEGEMWTIYNYVWIKGNVEKIHLKKDNGRENLTLKLSEDEARQYENMDGIDLDQYWLPTDRFPDTPSINANFIKKIGGSTMDNLWTRRNLYLLSKLFHLILETDEDVRLQLLYAFTHVVHLVSKMVVPRSEKGNRDFSGSWGRADYMIRNRSMEQNPVVIFERSCFDKQGVEKALLDAQRRLPENCSVKNISNNKKIKEKANLNFGVLDIADLCDVVADNSIDFIITDPPYGGLVQYMDLSMVWLIWLRHYNSKYAPDSTGEITYRKGKMNRDTYTMRLRNAFQNMYRVLKPKHYLVVTFHNQDINEWNDFVSAIRLAGFKFDKVTHQYNRRSGEANVSNPYGTTGSDFYIRCIKEKSSDIDIDKESLNNFVLERTISILTERGEKTPFSFIVNGLLPDMLQAGYLEPNAPSRELMEILSKNIGEDKIFSLEKNIPNSSGDILWFNNPDKYINFRSIPLTERVETTIKALLKRRVSVRYDDIVAELFKTYPNGQTPDPKGIVRIVEKFAKQSNGKWKLKDEVIRNCTQHTYVISQICKMGKRMGYDVFVGKREQREPLTNKQTLAGVASFNDLDSILSGQYTDEQIERIEMIDAIWLKDNKIAACFEVENSTDFIGAINRGSNVDADTPKFMVIPDDRIAEFLRNNDPLFVTNFRTTGWVYVTYSDIDFLSNKHDMQMRDMTNLSKTR